MGTPIENIDVVIIGAGPAGLASCFTALQENKKILVIDAGETALQLYASTQFDERFDGRLTGGLGGAAKIWGAQSGFLDKSTLQEWRQVIGVKNEFIDSLDKAREEMNELLEIAVRPDNFYEIKKENKLRQLSSKYGLNLRHTIYPKNGNIEWHWRKIINNPNIELMFNERLTKILHQDSNNVVLSFESGLTLELGSAKLILAAGTVSTTEIILRSYPNESKQFGIGMKLQDHPCGIVAGYVGKGNKQLVKGQILNSKYGTLKRKYEYRSIRASGVVELQYELNYKSPSTIEKLKANLNKLSQYFFKRLIVMPPKVNLWVQIEQMPENSLSLDGVTGRLISSWNCDENDLSAFKEIFKAAHEMLISEGFTIIDEPDFTQFKPTQAFHPSGTISMSTNPELGFVNEHGIIHKNKQIQIASAAIFPSPSWVNPTFLIMSLASLGTKKLLA
jgi:choline dehydrogenase-like flavoprotein